MMEPSLSRRFLLSLIVLVTAWTLTTITPISNVSADQSAAITNER